MPIYLSSSYLAPVQYYSKLYMADDVIIEHHDNYVKQTYRNRCVIAGANGPLPLTIPVEKPDAPKAPMRDIRISDHGNWRHLHWNALVSAYRTTPFFEYYEDDFRPFYEERWEFLVDFNEALRQKVCELIDLEPKVSFTDEFARNVPDECDFRDNISPKYRGTDDNYVPCEYYQVFASRHGFTPNLSIVDLLFNMGPESLIVLSKSFKG